MSTRVLYRDVIPYDTPSSLAALGGPAEGVLTLPVAGRRSLGPGCYG